MIMTEAFDQQTAINAIQDSGLVSSLLETGFIKDLLKIRSAKSVDKSIKIRCKRRISVCR
jgi:hypothetical protein